MDSGVFIGGHVWFIVGCDMMPYIAIDWEPIYQKNKGKWVALKQDEVTVIANGDTLQEAYDKAIVQGYLKPIMTRMPEQLIPFVGGYGLSV